MEIFESLSTASGSWERAWEAEHNGRSGGVVYRDRDPFRLPDTEPDDPGGLTLKEALYLSLPAWAPRGVRPKFHLSSQDPAKQAGAHAYWVDSRDWQTLLGVIGSRAADVMVEAKGKEYALAPMGVEIV